VTDPGVLTSVASADGTPIAYRTLGAVARGVIVVGGAMRTGQDYLPLARHIVEGATVHVVDRRGRGDSGPQGEQYSMDKEVADLVAVQAATGATAVFGHSYGGLVVLETAKVAPVFEQIMVYEPGVSINGSIPTGWMSRYRQLLAAGKERGAFAHFVRGSGHAPRPVRIMPTWYLQAILRIVIRAPQWDRMRPLLAVNLAEHEQVRALDCALASYAAITASTLLLAGGTSPPSSRTTLEALHHTITGSTVRILDGLDHNAPDENAPQPVAAEILHFLSLTEESRK